MNRPLSIATLGLMTMLALAGCNPFRVNLTFVGERTALERQVLGTYEEIGRDLASFGSVRGVNPDGSLSPPPARTTSQEAFLQAMANRQFNRDDVGTLLLVGHVREGRDGLLQPGESLSGSIPFSDVETAAIVDEENADRTTLIERLLQTTPGVTAEDRDRVAWVVATLNHDLAPPGAWLQNEDGTWRQK